MKRYPQYTQFILEASQKIGATIVLEPQYGYAGKINFADGKKSFFYGTSLDINSNGASRIARDKTYTCYFLHQAGYRVPEGALFMNPVYQERIDAQHIDNNPIAYARSLGYPVIIKPNNGSGGNGVYRASNESECSAVCAKLFEDVMHIRVERFYEGKDFRFLVFDGRAYAVYQRNPLSIVGDGSSTVRELLDQKLSFLANQGRGSFDADDPRYARILDRTGKTYNMVLDEGEGLQLLDNANLSTGGDVYDMTGVVHEGYTQRALRIAGEMNLRLAGVDFLITGDPSEFVEEQYICLEVNARPIARHYMSLGDAQKKRIQLMFDDMVQALSYETKTH